MLSQHAWSRSGAKAYLYRDSAVASSCVLYVVSDALKTIAAAARAAALAPTKSEPAHSTVMVSIIVIISITAILILPICFVART